MGSSSEKWVRKCGKFAQNYLKFFFVVSVVISCVTIAIALYLRYDWYIKNYIHGLEAYLIWTGPYILIASCSITIFLAIVGCIAFIQKNVSLLTAFIAGSGPTAVMTLSGVVCTLSYGTLFSPITPWLADRFMKYILEADSNPKYTRILRMIQEEVGCCGATSWQDYTDYNIPLPNECRDRVTGNVYEDTCDIVFSRFLQPFTGWMSGLGLLLLALQIFAVMASFLLRKLWNKSNREIRDLNEISYDPVKSRPV